MKECLRYLEKIWVLLFYGIVLHYLACYKSENVEDLSKSEFLEILI